MQEKAPGPAIVYTAVADGDLEALADLRAAAMRDSLERVGRYDPQRARQRLRDGWAPEHTWSIEVEGSRAGFYTLRPVDGGLKLDHLYILPASQNLGLGSRVMQRIAAQADEAGLAVHLGALRDSPSNAFYQRHGYVKTGEDPWDIYYVRSAR
ncbi:GNAT family N-acetyltransferase [Bordetella sp. LUAb4]|uniref:GNAT family N-acetyltransferase n=1 Tax=Bordetella sp. LUAb4 TaxID=2843195 RepID=UPI001E3B544F|nr:GNAT family N-acetyltransferase [Bordetella sp. LUAb4]